MVKLSISHSLHIDNNTFSKLDRDRFGELHSGYHNDTGGCETSSVLSAPSVIMPDYSTAPPYFSASISFVGV